MNLRTQGNLSGYLILFAALVLMILSDYASLVLHNSFIGNLLLLLGVLVVIIGILVLIG